MLLLLGACSGRVETPTYLPPGSPNAILVTEPDSLADDFLEAYQADRENWQKPQIVISCLGDLSNKVVADIGAGTGYFTMPLARLARKVIAVDIEQQFLDHIERRIARTPESEGLNVETRFTVPDDPALKPNEVDMVLLVNTYSFIDNRVAYFKQVLQGLRPGGRVVIVDFKYENLPVGPSVEDKVQPELVRAQLDSAGFKLVKIDQNSLDYQYIVTMERI